MHTTLQETSTQLVFGRDHVLNLKYEANWKNICDQKQKMINRNNQSENKKRKEYDYQVVQAVLVETKQSRKYGKKPYKGPYEVVKINNNGSVNLKSLLRRRAVYQPYNLRTFHPYKE